jgi:hypothetical protein
MRNEIMFSSVSIDINSSKKNYLKCGEKLIQSVLDNSKFKILILTNGIDYFKKYHNNPQVILESTENHNYPTHLSDKKYFNMHTKRKSLDLSSIHNSEYLIYLDCDSYLTSKWNDESSLMLFKNLDSDVYVNKIYSVVGKNIASEKSQTFSWKKIMGDLWDDQLFLKTYAPQETHIIFKNNIKFQKFNDFWKKIESESFKHKAKTDFIGYPIGCSITFAEMKIAYYSKLWTDYFEGYKLNHLGKETRIVSF